MLRRLLNDTEIQRRAQPVRWNFRWGGAELALIPLRIQRCPSWDHAHVEDLAVLAVKRSAIEGSCRPPDVEPGRYFPRLDIRKVGSADSTVAQARGLDTEFF
jgi:hypothetical protein